ncbi:MAG: GTP-binding protein [Thermoplasmata archaeon]|nr:MAG: GTP-binding protein [Thermoplasmata archaeon]
MMEIKKVSSKICFIGDGGVGKTSLIRRYVHDMFDDKYITTIGTKVSRKELIFDYPHRNVQVQLNAMIWDIMGQRAFRGLLKEAYFNGANGILGVCSLTDLDSLLSLVDWINSVKAMVGDIPIMILVNKSDLKEHSQFGDKEIQQIATLIGAEFLYTSAKTGENVPSAFDTIGKLMLKSQMNLT